jgi:hypothetical protein
MRPACLSLPLLAVVLTAQHPRRCDAVVEFFLN